MLSEPARDSVGRTVRLASLSPVTTDAARQLGWEVAAEAEEFTWEGLVAAILRAEAGMIPVTIASVVRQESSGHCGPLRTMPSTCEAQVSNSMKMRS